MRSRCERCNKHLSAESEHVYICSYECTWCSECNENEFKGNCPNCGGNLQLRPSRKK
ncbi:MAG: DUF1272 domain-containing protein [Flavobacteriaceae bacterium]